MTVLQSLLSTFRRSRHQARKTRRAAVASNTASEALEPRLLLTNPDPFNSLEGAPVTIYLDFDGHTETSQEWLDRRAAGTSGDIVTPVFSSDSDDNFNQAERDRIQEVFERVAEDFRPFNINVTTELPTAFNNTTELLVSVGGNGSWLPGTNPRYAAIKNSFSQGNLPQTAFVFSQNHTGLGGDFEYNMAASISAAVGVSLGLDVHLTSGGTPLEGDEFVAPILGDQIVGTDTNVANSNSLRDVWFNAPGATSAVQDDLAVIVGNLNPRIAYRDDDHGNSDTAATGITIGLGDEVVEGVIERNTDRDVFSFSTAATTVTIDVTGLDLRTQFSSPTPGSNLDPVLTLRDATGAVLDSVNPAGLQASISLDVPDGTYFIEVSNGDEYGNLGEYTLTLEGADVLPQFANPIALSSKPDAPVTFYLAFASDIIPDGDPLLAGRTSGTGDLSIPAFDSDGNITTFSAQEVDQITEIWSRVAEDFRPFNVNVTTINPNQFEDLQGLKVVIGGDGVELGSPDTLALLNGFSSAAESNTGLVFSQNIQNDPFTINDPKRIAYHVSATLGRMLGLEPHPLYNAAGTEVSSLDPGTAAVGPIMGAPDNSQRSIWVNAPSTSAALFQDDLAVITNPDSNAIVYRTDDHGNIPGLATPFPIDVGDDFVSGVIETQSDVDTFRIDTLAATMTVSVKGLDLSELFPGVNAGSNLDPVLELLDSAGTLLAQADVPFTLANGNASLTASITRAVPAGTYYVQVSNRGEYGNLGEYELRLQGVDSSPVTIDVTPTVYSEIDGVQAGVGVVRRPDGILFGPELVVDLLSTDPSEIQVPAQVTIPAGAAFANFDVTVMDDDLLDGDQRVSIVASVAGVENSRLFLTVEDYETISASVDPNPVAENAGTARLTLTRSNTDVDAPSHWVASNNLLQEFAPDGTPLRSIPIQWPTGGATPAGQRSHDIVVLEDGRVAIYNGSSNASLSIFNPVTDEWTHFDSIPGLSSIPADDSSGGIASIGNYVFLTDVEGVGDDTHGMVRIDVTTGEVTRFGEGTLGARLFAMRNVQGTEIYEINAQDGSVVNTLNLPLIPNSPFQYRALSVAFDGTSLWVLTTSGQSTFDRHVIKIDTDTGELLEEHNLVGMLNEPFLNAVTSLDGLLYLSSPVGFGTFFGMEIQPYDPVSRQPLTTIIGPENFTNFFFSDFISSVPSTGNLLLTDNGFFNRNGIYQIDTSIGLIQETFSASVPLGTTRGVTTIADVTIGGITYGVDDPNNPGELIYVARNSNTIDVYTLTGNRIDMDPSTPFVVDPLITDVIFNGDLAGADVPGVTTSDLRFRDVSIGFDGLLYGLLESGDEISVHDPETLVRVRGINLDTVVNSIAVGGENGIYAGASGGRVILFDFDGQTQSTLSTTLQLISDIEVNVGQEVLISGAGGAVALTTEVAVAAGDATQVTMLEDVGSLAFASFGRHPSRSTGNLAVRLTSDDVTGLVTPVTVIIPEGQQSVTVDIEVIDDNVRDGDQLVTVTAESPEYVTGSTQVTVVDIENVGVEVLPDAVVEGSGILPNVVRVFRTDVDGPLDFMSTSHGAVTEPQPIIDNDVSISEIVIPQQVSRITDVNVTLSIQHTAIPDLDVFLISPDGTRIALFNDLSSNASNLTNTVLDDQAAVRIVNGSAPFTGRFIPQQALANFIGQNPSGIWKLEIVDDSASDAGVLLDWSLEISTIGLSAATVTLVSDDTSEATVLGTVTIPANQAEYFVDLDVLDDELVDGTQTVNISATQVTIADIVQDSFVLAGDVVDVTDAEVLTLDLDRTTVSEGDGAGVITGTLTRLDTAGDLLVNLTSSDTSELAVPSSVTIPDGQASITFLIDAVDDVEFDGDQEVVISAGAAGYLSRDSETITVADQEPRLQLTTLTPVVAEDSGVVTFTLARLDAGDISQALVVNLTSSDLSELTLPASVIIPPGELSTTFEATILEDTLLDGSQAVTITASDANSADPSVNSTTFQLEVEDAEFLSISVPAGSDSILENAGAGAITATVSVSSLAHTEPIIVTLLNSDLTELSVPTQVVIPVGETSATFVIGAVDDPFIDRDQQVTVTARVQGYRDGVLNMTVRDHEPPTPIGPGFNVTDPTPSMMWAAVDGATRYDLWVNDVSRNINQLFRLENLPARAPLFHDDFESGDLSESKWTSENAEVDSLGLNINGTFSAHLNGNPSGGDQLESATIDLSGEPGAQLTYSWQRTGSLDSPTAGQDLILSYRNDAGDWVQLQRQFGVGPDMTVFRQSVVTLPADALHANFAFRFESVGDPEVADAGDTVDDWFVDDVSIAGFEKFEPIQEMGVGRYRYWIRAYDSLEQPGFWSSGQNFRIRTAPEITSPVANSYLAETQFPQFTWTSVVDTARYDLWINSVTTGESQVVRETDLQTTSFASATANLPGGTYKSWVRAIGPDGTEGIWSSGVEFTVLSTPTNISPSGSTFDRTPEIRWDEVEGASHYDVWVSQRNFGQPAQVILRDRFVTGNSRIPETDLADGRYAIWVRAIAEDGTTSPWSSPVEFTIGGRPAITSPTHEGTTSATPVITWVGINEADRYEVWINNSAGDRVVRDQNVRATSFAVTSPLPADTYRVWVRAISEMGEASAWSFRVDFTVVATADISPKLVDEGTDFGQSSPVALVEYRSVDPSMAARGMRVDVMAGDEFRSPIVRSASVVESDPASTQDPVAVEIPGIAQSADQSATVVTDAAGNAQCVDSVMSDWDTSDWWTETEEEANPGDSPSAAVALGILAAAGTLPKNNRRRRE